MKATFQIRISTNTNSPLFVSLAFNDMDKYKFSISKKFNYKIISDTIYYDFFMTGIEFKVKENKIRHLDDFDLEGVFTLEIYISKNRLKELYELNNEFLKLEDDDKDEIYKWIKKALSEFRQNALCLDGVTCKD